MKPIFRSNFFTRCCDLHRRYKPGGCSTIRKKNPLARENFVY